MPLDRSILYGTVFGWTAGLLRLRRGHAWNQPIADLERVEIMSVADRDFGELISWPCPRRCAVFPASGGQRQTKIEHMDKSLTEHAGGRVRPGGSGQRSACGPN
jgi:hypothetical protein